MNVVDTSGRHIEPGSLKSRIFPYRNIAPKHRNRTSRGVLRDLGSADGKAALLLRNLCKNGSHFLRCFLHKGSARRPEIFYSQIFEVSRVTFPCKKSDLVQSRIGEHIVVASGIQHAAGNFHRSHRGLRRIHRLLVQIGEGLVAVHHDL